MVQQVLQRFDFTYSSPQATPLSTSHSLSALPSEPSGPYPALVGCLMYLMTCTRPDLAYPLSILARYVAPGRHRPEHMAAAKRVLRYLCSTSGMGLVLGERRPVVLTGHADASWADDQATQRSSQGYTFSLGSGSVSWRSTRSSSVLSSSCEAEIYAGAMAAQELRWLTYLLTDLGELPRSAPVLYVDNKAMLALCREHRLEHRTKHIALRYFLARELQQRGQLRLAYVAFQANTADIFTKALPPGDHQRFCTMLDCVVFLLKRSSSNGSPGTTPTPPPASCLKTEEGTARRPRATSSKTPANQAAAFDPDMMEKFFSFMSFYEQHQQGAPAQSNNSNNNNATPMSLDGSSYVRGNQQQPTFVPFEPQRGSVSFMPRQQPSPEQEKTLDALQVQSQFAHVLKLETSKPFDGKDFFTWSFEFELMMEGAQILGFFDGSLLYPTNSTQYDKQQYTYQSMMTYTILLRNVTPNQQQNILSYRGYGNSAELAYNHLKNLKDNIDSSRDNIGKDNIDSSKDNIDSSKDNIGKDNILSSTDNIGSSRDNIGSNRNNGSSSSNIDTNRWSLNCIGSNRRHSTDSCAAA
ncbi:unnamed protein product [Closterium sp. NIES-54]